MGYYYTASGDKMPVDDHSTPEEKQKAWEQQQRDKGQSGEGGPDPASDGFGKVALDQILPPTEADVQAAFAAKQAAAAKAEYDARFQYGGGPGGASQAANYYQGAAAGAQARRGAQINYTNANGDRANNLSDRDQELSVADMMRKRAAGEVPSISSMEGARDANRLAAEQSSIAASARGPAGLALASQNAANASANGISTIDNNTQINSAKERLAAEQGALGAYSNVRGGDQSLQGQDAGQSIAQGQIDQQQQGLNDAFFNANSDRAVGINNAQLNAGMQKNAQETGQQQAAAALAQQKAQADQAHSDKMWGTAASVGGTILGTGGLIAASILGGQASKGGAADGVAGAGFGSGGTHAGANSVEGDRGYNGDGAPVASGGGGFDPCDPNAPGYDPNDPNCGAGSDDRLKVNVSSLSHAATKQSECKGGDCGCKSCAGTSSDAGAKTNVTSLSQAAALKQASQAGQNKMFYAKLAEEKREYDRDRSDRMWGAGLGAVGDALSTAATSMRSDSRTKERTMSLSEAASRRGETMRSDAHSKEEIEKLKGEIAVEEREAYLHGRTQSEMAGSQDDYRRQMRLPPRDHTPPWSYGGPMTQAELDDPSISDVQFDPWEGKDMRPKPSSVANPDAGAPPDAGARPDAGPPPPMGPPNELGESTSRRVPMVPGAVSHPDRPTPNRRLGAPVSPPRPPPSFEREAAPSDENTAPSDEFSKKQILSLAQNAPFYARRAYLQGRIHGHANHGAKPTQQEWWYGGRPASNEHAAVDADEDPWKGLDLRPPPEAAPPTIGVPPSLAPPKRSPPKHAPPKGTSPKRQPTAPSDPMTDVLTPPIESQSSDERSKRGIQSEDAMTVALAEGLAPHGYEYKPKYAALEGQKPGEKNVGIIAQNAERNPITGVIVERGDDGMRRINMKKSTSLALAAAGHNAQKIREQQAQIDSLKRRA